MISFEGICVLEAKRKKKKTLCNFTLKTVVPVGKSVRIANAPQYFPKP